MPLHLLVPSVVFGVVLVTALCWALGWGELARVDEATARARFLRDHPEAAVEAVVVASDARSALIRYSGPAFRGRRAVVFGVGDKLAVRLLDGARCEVGPDGLVVVFPDFGAPPVAVPGVDPAWGA